MRRWGPMLHPYEIVRSERWSFGLFTSFTLNLGFFETVVYDAWRGRRSQELNVNPFTACTLRTGGQQDICADSEKPACQQGASWTSYLSPRRRRLFSSRRFSISFAAWFRTRQSSFHVAWPSLLRAISAAQARQCRPLDASRRCCVILTQARRVRNLLTFAF